MSQIDPFEDRALEQLFTYQSTADTARRLNVTPEEVAQRYDAINRAALAFARTIRDACPPGADRSAAMRQVREARMTANAAIACAGI